MISMCSDDDGFMLQLRIIAWEDGDDIDQEALFLPRLPFKGSDVCGAKGLRLSGSVELFLQFSKVFLVGFVAAGNNLVRERGTNPCAGQAVGCWRKSVEGAWESCDATPHLIGTEDRSGCSEICHCSFMASSPDFVRMGRCAFEVIGFSS